MNSIISPYPYHVGHGGSLPRDVTNHEDRRPAPIERGLASTSRPRSPRSPWLNLNGRPVRPLFSAGLKTRPTVTCGTALHGLTDRRGPDSRPGR